MDERFLSMNQDDTLIVDFPQPKSVSFSPHSSGVYINYPTQSEILAKWNDVEDEMQFRRQLELDAVTCSRKIVQYLSGQGEGRLDYQDCVGLDNLISRDVPQKMKAVRAARRRHARIVLQEQVRQRFANVDSTQELARVSRASSRSERLRARKVGILHATIV